MKEKLDELRESLYSLHGFDDKDKVNIDGKWWTNTSHLLLTKLPNKTPNVFVFVHMLKIFNNEYLKLSLKLTNND